MNPRFFFLALSFLASCASPWLDLQRQSLGYTRLAKAYPSPWAPACLDAALRTALAVQAFLESRAQSMSTTSTFTLQTQACLTYQEMLLLCKPFGTPLFAEKIGSLSKEDIHVRHDA